MRVVKLLSLWALCSCANSGSVADSGPRALGPGADAGPLNSGRHCSGDLRSILDESDAVIETCGDHLGCREGTCAPACEAAAASRGNLGCAFALSTPSFYTPIKPPCFAVFVANAWPRPATLSVSRAGVSYDVTKFGRLASAGDVGSWPSVPATGVPTGQVAVLFMSSDPDSASGIGGAMTCPVAPAIGTFTAYYTGETAATGRGTGFSITSDVPVSAYDILPFGGARSYLPSAQMLMPISSWGDNFVVAQPPRSNWAGGYQAHWLHVLAASDNTEVTLVPNHGLLEGVGVSAAPANTVSKFKLNAGEFIQWQDTTDISGSVVSANQPVAVMGGQVELCWKTQTAKGGGCDSTHQLVPPVRALGSEYAVAPCPSRDAFDESISYRIVGAVDGTVLSFEPKMWGLPATTERGKVDTFEMSGPFTVKSQDNAHPFVIAQIIGGVSGIADEEYLHLLPPAQFLNRYVFFADPSYSSSHVVVIRVKGKKGFSDVEISGVGKIGGWQKFGQSYEYATAEVTPGPLTATSDGLFGVTVWGYAQSASYGYPAGGNAAGINQVIVSAVPR